jgi:hydroxymethylpyrimidine pyrophosphatase-like HAD family hydrolase
MFFHSVKGVIALDIDGTITADAHILDPKIVEIFSHLDQEGWKFIFLTGRPFQWSYRTLEPLTFSYALAVQNGALLLEMPSKKVISRKYLSSALLPSLEDLCRAFFTDFVIYSGFENDDWCYYRPSHLPSSILAYVLERSTYLGEKWEPLSTFSHLPVSSFSSIKFFAKEKEAFCLSQHIMKNLNLPAPPNRDPFNPDYFVVQVTHAEATKGGVLKEFIHLNKVSGPIIAAGDDYNDQSMLQEADVKIVMANAPSDLLKSADIIAPPASKMGIIQGLTEAIHRVNTNWGKACV